MVQSETPKLSAAPNKFISKCLRRDSHLLEMVPSLPLSALSECLFKTRTVLTKGIRKFLLTVNRTSQRLQPLCLQQKDMLHHASLWVTVAGKTQSEHLGTQKQLCNHHRPFWPSHDESEHHEPREPR